jgi:hypothetical protein
MFMGLSVPAYFEGLGPYAPKWSDVSVNMNESLRGILQSIGTTGMGVAAIIGITLDNLIPGTPEERGLKLPSLLAPEGADATEGGPAGRR